MYTFHRSQPWNVHIQLLACGMYTFHAWLIECIHSTVIYIQCNIYIIHQKFIYYPKLPTPLWSDLLAMNNGYPKIIHHLEHTKSSWLSGVLLCCNFEQFFKTTNWTNCLWLCLLTQLGYKLINLLLGPCIKPAKRLSELFHVSLDA